MAVLRPSRWVVVAGVFLAVHLTLSLTIGREHTHYMVVFGDVLQTVLPLLAAAVFAANAEHTRGPARLFYILLVAGCLLWVAAQFSWVYFEVLKNVEVPDPFLGDVIYFLHIVPMIGAVALQPHIRYEDRTVRFGSIDFLLLLLWWVFLYLFIVIPWQYVSFDYPLYGSSFNKLYMIENVILVAALAILWLQSHGGWKRVYGHIFGASALYLASSLAINHAINLGQDQFGHDVYYTGSVYDVPLAASMCWFIGAGLLALQIKVSPEEARTSLERHGVWPARTAMAAVLSIPPLALWALSEPNVPSSVRSFRLVVSFGAVLVLTFLMFAKQHLLDQSLLKLLRQSRGAYDDLRRMQNQLLHSEKLASLGQLVAGAAHEINNPLTAILGYSDLLAQSPRLEQNEKVVAQKIGNQARRTKTLVSNLLSFARQAPAEMTAVDLNTVVRNAVKLRQPEIGARKVKVELQLDPNLPAVSGDENQLLQVALHIVANAVDAVLEVGGGSVTISSRQEAGDVLLEFSDTGPGIKEPARIFDPFYTTKPVGKGAGLGLSACYGIVQEHKGRITCQNSPSGGAIFRIYLPVSVPVAANPAVSVN